MSNKNCPNCGAPYDMEHNKCPYCGTYYFDMSCIDFTSNEPIYLKIKVPNGKQELYITQLVVPSIDSMEFSTDTTDVVDLRGRHIATFRKSMQLNTNISFLAIPDSKSGSLCTVQVCEQRAGDGVLAEVMLGFFVGIIVGVVIMSLLWILDD